MGVAAAGLDGDGSERPPNLKAWGALEADPAKHGVAVNRWRIGEKVASLCHVAVGATAVEGQAMPA